MSLTYAEAAPLVGQSVTVHTSHGLVQLLLIEAQERSRRGLPEQFRTPLSLVFTANSNIALGQDNYTVEHEAFGQRQWMIVPILPPSITDTGSSTSGPDLNRLRYYQVVFS